MLASILATASGADANTSSTLFIGSVAEAGSGSSTVAVQVAFAGTVAEVASAVVDLAVEAIINVFPVGIQIYVQIGGVLIWAVIDDTQIPNWQNVGTAQSPSWTVLPS
jgi:hypothetical protein